jgi:hypothetical protein
MLNKNCSRIFGVESIIISIIYIIFSLMVNGDETLLEPYSKSAKGPTLRDEIALKFNRSHPSEGIRIVVRYGAVEGDMDALSGKDFQNIKSVALSSICEGVTRENTRFLSVLPKLDELEIGFGFDKNSTSLLPVCSSVKKFSLPFLAIDINSEMSEEILRLFPKLKKLGLPRWAKLDVSSIQLFEKSGVEIFSMSAVKP